MNFSVGDRWRRGARLLSRRAWYAVCVVAVVLAVALVWTASCSDGVSAAEGLVSEGDLEGAEAVYKEILTEDPDDARALDGLAVVLMWRQEYEEAAAIQERAAASDESNILVRVELGFNYLNHLDRTADAVRVFSEAVALEPSGKNLAFLAQAQIEDGRPADAESSLKRAIDEDPQYPHSYVVLIGLLEQQHRASEADQTRQLAAENGVALEGEQPSQQ